MVCRTAVAVVTLAMSLPLLAAEEEPPSFLRLSNLHPGQNLRVQTAEREYHIQLIDRSTGESLVAASLDGRTFSPATRMFIVGATPGRQPGDGGYQLVLMGELHEGMCIEWGKDSLAAANRGVTSPVRSIALVSRALAPWAAAAQ